MNIIKNLTFAALAATLLCQTSITRADDHGQKGDDHGQQAVPSNPFVILLQGTFEPVVHGPDLGLSQVDLNDGTYLKVPIYGVSGIPGTKKDKAVGTLYGSMADGLFAYHLSGGSFSAKLLSSDTVVVPDGEGGIYIKGTYELDLLEATGIYRPFAGGHIHMVDTLYITAAGVFEEIGCYCHVSH